MNFFRSILADDPDPNESEISNQSAADSTHIVSDNDVGDVSIDRKANAWSFGGLFKDIAARSESVIEIYRKDLEEFGSGLRKESEIIRVAASRAVKDIPVSLEAGASAAHVVLDGVLKSTAEIISKETRFNGSDGEADTPGTNSGLTSGRYSRFEAQLSALQNDLNTFCEDPDDVEEFKNWRSAFQLDEKSEEIDYLVVESGTLEGIYKKVVPSVVDRETFWCRYFYRLDKLKQQEKIRANLVKRAISRDDDDDELSWDFDDVEEGHEVNQETVVKKKTSSEDADKGVIFASSDLAEKSNHLNENVAHEENEGATVVIDSDEKNEFVVSSEKTSAENSQDDVGKNSAVEPKKESYGDVLEHQKEDESRIEKDGDKRVGVEGSDNVGGEKRDQLMRTEDDSNNMSTETLKVKDDLNHEANEKVDELSWDEIEDVGSNEENKNSAANHGVTADRGVLRKQLNSNEDDEDMSWDIEDDDVPVISR